MLKSLACSDSVSTFVFHRMILINIKQTTKSTRRSLHDRRVAAAFPFASTEAVFEIVSRTSSTASLYEIYIARRDSALAVHLVSKRFRNLNEFSTFSISYHSKDCASLYWRRKKHTLLVVCRIALKRWG